MIIQVPALKAEKTILESMEKSGKAEKKIVENEFRIIKVASIKKLFKYLNKGRC
jgi:predicted AAA+ superfamily ATPase